MGYRIRNKKSKPKDKTPAKGRYGKKVENWAIGVTACPRVHAVTKKDNCTYNECIDSILATGWDWCHLFCEPDTKLAYRHSEFPQTHRKEKFGAWKNFFHGLIELIDTYPNADCYGMIQDDMVFCKGVRDYLEDCLWPAEKIGLTSVYMPSHYTKDVQGWYKNNRGRGLWSACTFFFTPEAARDCVSYKVCKEWTGERNVDNVVGRWARERRLPPYYHAPSLAQHIGEVSACWSHKQHARGRRAACDFIGEDYNIHTERREIWDTN